MTAMQVYRDDGPLGALIGRASRGVGSPFVARFLTPPAPWPAHSSRWRVAS